MNMPNRLKHGSLAGWTFHLLANIPACPACLAWHDQYRMEYSDSYEVVHGSTRGYHWHKVAQIPLCDPCRVANRDYENGLRATRKAQR
jgi:hypothetical protein